MQFKKISEFILTLSENELRSLQSFLGRAKDIIIGKKERKIYIYADEIYILNDIVSIEPLEKDKS